MFWQPPSKIVHVHDGTPCSVMDSWDLGGGRGHIKSKHVFPYNSDGAMCVEFDDAPGFWWLIPRALVVWGSAAEEEVPEEVRSL